MRRYVSREMPWCESECSIGSHSSRARASISASGTSTVAPPTAASSAASRNSASIRAPRLGQARADVLAQLVERVEARLGGELVVELGQLLGLDLADGDRELGLLAGQLVGAP